MKKYTKNLFVAQFQGENYSKVPQELNNTRGIDYSVKGLYTQFFMLPPNWNINIQYLINMSGNSETKIRNDLKFLEEIGYLHRISLRNSNGKIAEWGYYVSLKPENEEEVDMFLKENAPRWFRTKINKKTSPTITKNMEVVVNSQIPKNPQLAKPSTGSEADVVIIKGKAPRIENNINKIKPKGLINRNQMRKKLDEQSEKESLSLKSANEAFIAEVKANAALWELFTLWYSNVMPEKGKKHFTETKSFQNAVEYIKQANQGTLFKELSINDPLFKYKNGKELYKAKIPLETIKECIELHIKSLLPEYEPMKKSSSRMHLDLFLLNPYSPYRKSHLAYWMANDPEPAIPLKGIKDEQLFNSLLEELNWEDKYNSEKNKIISFINKHHDFLFKLKENPIRYDKNFKAKAIIEGINNSFIAKDDDFEITPSTFMNKGLDKNIEELIADSSWIV